MRKRLPLGSQGVRAAREEPKGLFPAMSPTMPDHKEIRGPSNHSTALHPPTLYLPSIPQEDG